MSYKQPSLLELKVFQILLAAAGASFEELDEKAFFIGFHARYWVVWHQSGYWIETNEQLKPQDEFRFSTLDDFFHTNIHQYKVNNPPEKRNKQWTEEEQTLLVDLVLRDRPVHYIATRLDRSVNSVILKAERLLNINILASIPVLISSDKSIQELINES